MKAKLALFAVCAGLLFALSGCASTDYSGQTILGEVTAIDGAVVTVEVGEFASPGDAGEAGSPDNAGDAPGDAAPGDSDADSADDASSSADAAAQGSEAENSDASDSSSSSSNSEAANEPPAKPEGEGADEGSGEGEAGTSSDANASSDDGASGEAPDDAPGEPPSRQGEAPSDAPDGTSSGEGEPPSDAPDAPSDGGGMPTDQFESSGSTATFDLTDATFDGTSLDAIEEGTILKLVVGEGNTVEAVSLASGGMGSGGASGEVNQGTAANTISEDTTVEAESYTSTGDDENALRVTDGAAVTLNDVTVEKTSGSSSNTEEGDFYGMNAALLATDGAQLTVSGGSVTSSAQNGNGIFSYGEGTVVNVANTAITTSADNSGGLQTTGGGTTNATNVTVETGGSSSAAIRSDRGGGTVNVDGGSYTSSGYNSPAIYSTAAITAKNALLTAKNSEALVIEGQNSIALEDCTVSGTMSSTEGTSSDENVHTVMIYQSMSGDAEVGTSQFTMTGGTLTSNNGDVFYVTNTHCEMKLSGVDIQNKGDGALLRVVGNSATRGWGSAGENGGQLDLELDGQQLEGALVVDTISTLNVTLSNGSELTGTITIEENEQGGTAVDENAVVTIDKGCTWNLTGDCTLTSLENNGTINFNGYKITLADGTVLQ